MLLELLIILITLTGMTYVMNMGCMFMMKLILNPMEWDTTQTKRWVMIPFG